MENLEYSLSDLYYTSVGAVRKEIHENTVEPYQMTLEDYTV